MLGERSRSAVSSLPSLAVRAAKTASSVDSQPRKKGESPDQAPVEAVVTTCSRGIPGCVDSVKARLHASTFPKAWSVVTAWSGCPLRIH
jgi:hypothetical protein